VMHRFDLDNVQFTADMHAKGLFASISLGVKKPDYDTVDQLLARGLVPEYITIDIAHGHADSVRNMITYLKDKMPASFVIAGNVATPEAVIDLENWGADATKVGVGPGKVCITKLKTGFGTGGWQLSALKWCARVATKPIIADGGIRNHGDIAKSIRFGASMVMIGSLFAGHEESPGKSVEVDGEMFKEYYGSASDFNKGEYKHVEGKRILEPIKGRLADTLIEMEQDVQSSISYSGGKKLMDIRKVNYVTLGGSNAAEHLLM
jgi:GMP reductase